MTLFGKGDITDIINLKILRQAHSRLFRKSLKPMISVLVRDTRGRHKGEEEKVMWGWKPRYEWCAHKPRNTWGPGSWKRRGRILSWNFQRARSSADILISSFWPPELRVVLLFQATWIVVTYYGRCRKLTYLLYLLFWIFYIFWIVANICSHSVNLISNILVLRVLGSRILAAVWNIEVLVSSGWSGRKDETHRTVNEQYPFIF